MLYCIECIFGIAVCVYLVTCFGDRDVQMDGMPSGGVPPKVATSVVLSKREREKEFGTGDRGKRMSGFAKTRWRAFET